MIRLFESVGADAPTAELFATNNLLGLRNVFQKTDIHVEYTWIN
jgi:hypothetical protein